MKLLVLQILLVVCVAVAVAVVVGVVRHCNYHGCNQIETDGRNPRAAESISSKWFHPKSNGRQKIFYAQRAGRHFDEDGILLL
jgi:hypothetical protein